MGDIPEEKKLKGLRQLAEETGVPLRTLQDAAKNGRLIATRINDKAWASTLEAVNEWKSDPDVHRGAWRNKQK